MIQTRGNMKLLDTTLVLLGLLSMGHCAAGIMMNDETVKETDDLVKAQSLEFFDDNEDGVISWREYSSNSQGIQGSMGEKAWEVYQLAIAAFKGVCEAKGYSGPDLNNCALNEDEYAKVLTWFSKGLLAWVWKLI